MTNGLYILFWRWHTCVHQSSPIRKGISCLVVVLSLTGYDLVPKVTTCFHHFSPLLHFIALMIFIWMFYDFCFTFNSPTFSDWDSDPTHTTYKILELLQADFTSNRCVPLAEKPWFGTWNSVILLQWWKKHFPRPCFCSDDFSGGKGKSHHFWSAPEKCTEVWRSYHMNQLGYRTAGFFGGARHKLMGLTSKHVEIVNHFNHLKYQNVNRWIMIKTKK